METGKPQILYFWKSRFNICVLRSSSRTPSPPHSATGCCSCSGSCCCSWAGWSCSGRSPSSSWTGSSVRSSAAGRNHKSIALHSPTPQSALQTSALLQVVSQYREPGPGGPGEGDPAAHPGPGPARGVRCGPLVLVFCSQYSGEGQVGTNHELLEDLQSEVRFRIGSDLELPRLPPVAQSASVNLCCWNALVYKTFDLVDLLTSLCKMVSLGNE